MKKINTLYKKDPKDLSRVINEVNPENEWVLKGEGIPTRKFDGTATYIKNKEIYKRYDAKPNKKKIQNFQVGNNVSKKSNKPFKNGELIDEIVELLNNPQSPNNAPAAKLKNSDTIVNLEQLFIVGNWSIEDFKDIPEGAIPCQEPDVITGHYPHWVKCDRNNPADKYHFESFDLLEDKQDGTYELCGEKLQGNPEQIQGHILIKHGSVILDINDFSFENLKTYFQTVDIEGIVFHHKTDDRMCKIRLCDFSIERKRM